MFYYSQMFYTESFAGNLDGGIKFQVHPKNVPAEIEKHGSSVGAAMLAAIEVRKSTVSTCACVNIRRPTIMT